MDRREDECMEGRWLSGWEEGWREGRWVGEWLLSISDWHALVGFAFFLYGLRVVWSIAMREVVGIG